MATIIDALIIKLGMDAAAFYAEKNKVGKALGDTGGEADKAAAKLKNAGKTGATSFAEIATSAAKFLAVIGGTMAIKNFIEQTIESNAALDRLSKNLQENVSTISAWSNSAELAGGSAEGLQGTLDMLSKSQTELQLTGQSQLIPYFSALGVSIADASGKARSGADIMLDLSDKFSKLDRTTANNMGRMMGIDPGTMNLLLKGRSEVELLTKRQKEHNAVTKQQAEESSRLQAAMIGSRQTFSAFGRELLSTVTPAIEGFFNMLSSVGAWARENKGFLQAFFILLAGAITIYYLPAMIAAAAATWAAIAPLLAIVVPIMLVAAALAALWDDYQTWKRGGDSLINWSMWQSGLDKAAAGISWFKNLLADLIYRAAAAADAVGAIMAGDWKRVKFAAGEVMSGNGKPYGGGSPPQKPTVAQQNAAAPKGDLDTKPISTAKPISRTTGGEQQALDYFQKQGWSKEQAAGLAGNFKRESEFRPDAVGDNGKAYGIAQWHPDRQAEFKKKFGKDIKGSTLEEQLAFVHYELTSGNEKSAGDKLRASKSAQDAAAAISKYYERPADREGEAAKRGQLAAAMMGGSYTDRRAAAGIAPIPPQPTIAAGSAPLAGIPGASAAAQGAGAARAAQATSASPAPAAAGATVDTHIGEINVYTTATDAKGIAADMGKSMDYLFTSQANYGLT